MAAEAVVRITAAKVGVGAILPVGEFHFGVFEGNSIQPITTGNNQANGSIRFTDFYLDHEGEYNYVIRETSSPGGWIADQTEFPVKVEVVLESDNEDDDDDDDNDRLVAYIEYTDGFPLFVNTLRNVDDGLVEFPCIRFTEEGDFEYTIRETTPDGDGWTTDKREYEVIIHVVDDGQGNLIPTIEYVGGEFPSFVNTYHANEICVPLSAINSVAPCRLK